MTKADKAQAVAAENVLFFSFSNFLLSITHAHFLSVRIVSSLRPALQEVIQSRVLVVVLARIKRVPEKAEALVELPRL
jgi:hypothetical protein